MPTNWWVFISKANTKWCLQFQTFNETDMVSISLEIDGKPACVECWLRGLKHKTNARKDSKNTTMPQAPHTAGQKL
jgi:hypothetical protein